MNMYKRIAPDKIMSIPTITLISLLLLLLTGCSEETNTISPEGQSTEKQVKPAVNAAIAEYEPALAIRASGCITCHAEIHSRFITDFGYGSPYFFGNPDGGNKVGPFNGHIYGDFLSEPGKTGWITAEFHNDIIIPQADLDFKLKDVAGTDLGDHPSYRDALQAESLAEYIQSLEDQKTDPAPIIEKKKIFIGAPDTATLETRLGITPGSTSDFKYIKNDQSVSPDFNGIGRSENGDYYTNTSEIVCDGDLFVRGILFLNKATIVTDTGCRIYTDGPIFLQNAVTYRSIDDRYDRANLQLVSTEAIFLGVGQKKCNTPADSDPFSLRLLKTPALTSIITRSTAHKNISPQEFSQSMYDKTSLVPLEDSSCHDETLGFSRMLLNAPIVHSRYNGKFKGLVIAEFALFWQGKSSYEFDPIFKKVPVLPLLKDEDYLLVE